MALAVGVFDLRSPVHNSHLVATFFFLSFHLSSSPRSRAQEDDGG